MKTLWKDLKYGIRMMLKNPLITLVVLFTLMLGIGANTAIFSIVNAVLLRPLPFNKSERLVTFSNAQGGDATDSSSYSTLDLKDIQSQTQTLQYVAAYQSSGFALNNGDDTERLFGADVSLDFFSVLDVKPMLGRTFTREEDVFGGPRVILISYGLWQRRFNRDPEIVGKQIFVGMSKRGYTIVGVMPQGFQFPLGTRQRDYWSPLNTDLDPQQVRRDERYLPIVGRLKPGVSIEQAKAEMQTIAKRLESEYPQTNTEVYFQPLSLHKDLTGNIRPALWILFGAVGFVLLIACANVANLLLARATARQKEIALRMALGAGRARIIRQLLTENLILAFLGGSLGLLVGTWGLDLFIKNYSETIPRLQEVNLDVRVLGFTMLVSLLTGIIFGLAPALKSSKSDLNETLKDGGRGTSSLRGNRLSRALVIAEVALSLVLLIGAGLLMRTFVHLLNTDAGFDSSQRLVLDLPISPSKYKEPAQQIDVFRQMEAQLKNVPGVKDVGMATTLPLTDDSIVYDFDIKGRPPFPLNDRQSANYRVINPNFFRSINIPVKKGRAFSDADTDKSVPVMMINETFARRYFPGEDPIGKGVIINNETPIPREVIGVVGDVRAEGLDKETLPEFYLSYLQNPVTRFRVIVHTESKNPTSMVAATRAAVKQVNPQQLIWDVTTMETHYADSLSQRRFSLLLFGIFAVVALVMAAVGLFGVMSYAVTQRTHEVGIRLALGATAFDVLKLIVGQGMRLALIGVGLGLLLSFGLTRLMEKLLYGVSATDTFTFVAISALLSLVALVACYLPARRATKVDPVIALRYE